MVVSEWQPCLCQSTPGQLWLHCRSPPQCVWEWLKIVWSSLESSDLIRCHTSARTGTTSLRKPYCYFSVIYKSVSSVIITVRSSVYKKYSVVSLLLLKAVCLQSMSFSQPFSPASLTFHTNESHVLKSKTCSWVIKTAIVHFKNKHFCVLSCLNL